MYVHTEPTARQDTNLYYLVPEPPRGRSPGPRDTRVFAFAIGTGVIGDTGKGSRVEDKQYWQDAHEYLHRSQLRGICHVGCCASALIVRQLRKASMLIIFAVLATSRGRFSTVNLDLPPDQNLPPIFTAPSCGDDPNGCRSLWDIIWSCLSTMFLCTWVVIHPNIPGPEEPWTKVALRRVGIVTATLIAPEIILSWAVRQLIVAVKLAKKHKGESVER